jgi:hypothetical protein
MTWKKKYKGFSLSCSVSVLFVFLVVGTGGASSNYILSEGQTVYVPVYSNVYSSPKEVPNSLANLLSIRNTDTSQAIRITAADYYDTKGKLVKKHLSDAMTLAPLESTHIYLSERDEAGGVGANFIVRWEAAKEVNTPIIECVMVGNQGRAFVAPGRVIKDSGE